MLTLRGDAATRGAAQGKLLRAEIRALARRYVHGLVVRGLGGWAKALAVARAAEPFIPADLRAELRAMARAAGVRYEELLIFNAHVDALASGCTSVTAQGAATADHGVLLGRDLDWSAPPGMENLALLVVRHVTGRIPVASYTYPGFLGVLTAVSRAGVAVSMNVSASRDHAHRCTPTPLLLMDALEHARTAEALLTAVAKGSRCSGFLITAADAVHGGRVLEMTAHHTARRSPADDLLASTNHFQAARMLPLQATEYAGSRVRLNAIRGDLAGARPLTAGRLASLLHRRPVFNRGTLMTVVAALRTRTLLLWQRGMRRNSFREVELNPLWASPHQAPRPRR